MANVQQLKKMLVATSKVGLVPNIIGMHGIGKSQIVRKTYEDLGYNVVDIRLGQMADSGDLIGLPEFDRDEAARAIATRFITPSRFPAKGIQTVIFFDEINRANKDILQAIFEIVLDKSMGDYSMDTSIIEDGPAKGMPMQVLVTGMNPPTDDYSTLDFQDKAFQDRFLHIKFEPTVTEWATYQRANGMSPSLVAFFVDQPAMLEIPGAPFSLSDVEPSRRSAEALDLLYTQNLEKSLFIELSHGLIGTKSAVALQSFLANYDEKLSGIDVLKKYASVAEKVKKFSDPKSDRTDILNNTIEEICDYMLQKKKLTKTEQLNLVKFIMAIPAGLSVAAVQKLLIGELNPVFNKCDHLSESQELADYLKKMNAKTLAAKKVASDKETKK